ncbi:class I SAM-dependent methyltransferase [Arthrobacter zhaoguopingii]|uniref:class I SAM-dependent methyltransferase n=1 Tax=Arthrobacter zhaoguopingii TaxID=2681491 RepID=UPI001915C843|nr:methyltransferase domain-containing protein [Arthrobacter zhaoguopingii]
MDLLDLRRGAQVLDVGCGTGLNFALLQERIGPAGMILGIDRSPGMLRRARRRAERSGWANVLLVRADATTLRPAAVGACAVAHGGRALSDAALATYSLSLMPSWEDAWERMLALSSPGASVAVVDMQEPTGRFAAAAPLARLACRLGGSDIAAHPWTAVERGLPDLRSASVRGGHIQIRTGRHSTGGGTPTGT